MLEVTKLWVRSFDLDHLDVFWEIAPLRWTNRGEGTQHDIFDYEFVVLRSEAAMGPYQPVGPALRDTYHFRDVSVSLLHKWRQFHYKLQVRHIPTGKVDEVGPTSHKEPAPDLIAAEVIRQEDMLFREFIGRKCYLFPVRTFGPLCNCYDPTTGRRTRSQHLPCYGTGFLGGYMSPVEVYVQLEPAQKAVQLGSLGEGNPRATTGRMISFPPVAPKDILVESENVRWRVGVVGGTERLRAVVRQEFQLSELPKGDIEYALPIQVNARTLEPAAERNFTNPQNLETDGDYADIFAVYGKPRGTLR